MLSEPSSARILASIRTALQERVAPVVTERTATATLEAIDLMLASLIRRVESEAGWMRQEIDAVVEFARTCISKGTDLDGDLAARLKTFSLGEDAVFADDLRAQYKTAGALLNRCLDHASRAGGELQSKADAIILNRVAHETDLLGAFHIVGKS